jgi:uncharacterized membrane protein YdjX (TVP38/TMEM64 family)
MLTYCAGCVSRLRNTAPTSHILDLVFAPEATAGGRERVSRAPFTYLNRLRLKTWFKSRVSVATSRERTFTPHQEKKGGIWGKLALLALVAGGVAALRLTGAADQITTENLRAAISGAGAWGPLIYMLVYTFAPALMLPGLPISIAGGLLFGPFWGVVYTITSSTAGACLAFLISRHLARGWVEKRLRGPRWRRFDRQVEEHGWKIVAFTRLIPLFPFNLLNYAFGLTKVRFWHYAAATFLFMLPACIAFLTFSSSLLDLLNGKISPEFVAGFLLMVAVSSIPAFYRGYGARKEVPLGGLGAAFKRKLAGLALLVAGTAAVTLWIRANFWRFDAYWYTFEFHLGFLSGQLQAANTPLIGEYLRGAGAFSGLFLMGLGNLLQALTFPFTPVVLADAAALAWGGFAGSILAFSASFLAALAFWGAGSLLLGDILPFLARRRGKAAMPRPTGWWEVPGLLLAATPWVPVALVPLAAGFLRVSFLRLALWMGGGLVLRMVLNTLFA